MLTHTEPPGYRMREPRKKRKLDPFLPIIHEMLEADKKAPTKQRHTATRIFHRLQEEHGYDGGYTSVRDAVRQWRETSQEVSYRSPIPRDRPKSTLAMAMST